MACSWMRFLFGNISFEKQKNTTWMRWSSGRLPVLISALLKEKEQEGALGQKNIVILVGVLNDFDSVSALVVVGVLNALKLANGSTLGEPTFPKSSLLAANSPLSWVSASSGNSSLLTFKINVFLVYFEV